MGAVMPRAQEVGLLSPNGPVVLEGVGLVEQVDVGEPLSPGRDDLGLGPPEAQAEGDQVGPRLHRGLDQVLLARGAAAGRRAACRGSCSASGLVAAGC